MFSMASCFRMRAATATVYADLLWLKIKISFILTLLFLCFVDFTSAMRMPTQKKDSEQMEIAKTRSLSASNIIWRENVFYKYAPGSIVFLVGTSSAGKSSIARYMASCIGNSDNFLFTGTDIIGDSILMDFIKRELSGNIYEKMHSVVGDNLLVDCAGLSISYTSSKYATKIIEDTIPAEHRDSFLSSVWNPLLDRLSKVLNEEYLMTLMYSLEQLLTPAMLSKKTVIADVLSLDEFIIALERNFIRCNINIAVIYCSPQKVLERTVSRNVKSMSANPGEVRLFFPFSQYESVYTPVRLVANDSKKAITLKKCEFLISLGNAMARLPESICISADYKKLLLEDLDNIAFWEENCRQRLLKNWFFAGETVSIEPRAHYDILIDTGIISFETAFEMIKPMLRLR